MMYSLVFVLIFSCLIALGKESKSFTDETWLLRSNAIMKAIKSENPSNDQLRIAAASIADYAHDITMEDDDTIRAKKRATLDAFIEQINSVYPQCFKLTSDVEVVSYLEAAEISRKEIKNKKGLEKLMVGVSMDVYSEARQKGAEEMTPKLEKSLIACREEKQYRAGYGPLYERFKSQDAEAKRSQASEVSIKKSKNLEIIDGMEVWDSLPPLKSAKKLK